MITKKIRYLPLLILLLWSDALNAQPANDDCANASTINIGSGGWAFGTFYSDTVSLNGATLQFGEWVHPLQVANQKSVWFKFSIPTTRTVIITLMQPGVAPFPMPATAAGWTLYRTNTCFPGSAQVVDPPILNIEGYTHKCLKKGDYLLQVTGTLAANDLIFVRIETAPPSSDETKYDHSAQPYNFGVISGGPASHIYEVGCQSITPYETQCPNLNFNKSSWHIFTTDAAVDFYRFEIQETPWLGTLYSTPRQWGYRLYKGNCINDSIPDGIPAGGQNLTEIVPCKTLEQINAWSYGVDFSPCLLEPNTTYSIQLFIPDNYASQIEIRMYEVGGGNEVSYNPVPVIASHNLGTLNYGTTSIGDYLTCQGRLSLYNTPPCPPALPASGYFNIGGNKYELASWKTFTLGTQTDVSFSFTAWNQPGLAVRIYQGNINNVGCAGLTLFTQFINNATIRCMPAGDYTVQVLGILDSANSHQNWASNLGRYHTLHINVLYTFSQAFGLHNPTQIDNVNSGNPLPNGSTIYATSDTIDCQNTVLPDGDVCGAANVRAIYRKVVINQNGILSVGGGNWWRFSYRLYRGDASALPIVNGKIQGLVDQAGCQSTFWPFKVCVTPGIYTLVSFADSGDVGESDKPWFRFDVVPAPHTLFNSPATAENMGSLTIPSPLTISGTSTRFTCDDNPLTILGYAPCYGATKQIYREFYVSQPSLLTFTPHHTCHVTCDGGVAYRIFSGRISNGTLTGLYKDCHGGFTECVPPGWYTVVSYGYGKTFTNPEYTSGRGGLIGDYENVSISINPNVQLHRTIATAYDAGTTDWYPNGAHTAAIPKNWMNYSLGYDFFDCAAGPVEVTACPGGGYNRASWRKFTITKTSYVYITGFPGGTQSRLYAGDLSINPAAPIYHDCITDQMRLCSLPPGTYTLVTFANNSHIGVGFTPNLYIDSVGVSKFDHAAQAYDFGNIPNDNVQYFGKIGDPLGPFGRQPSEDFFFCTTGALASDPSNNCPIGQNPPPNPLPNPTNPRRNLWYTFTVTGPGTVYVSVYNLTSGKSNQSPFTVYYSPNTTIPPNDSLSPPLQYVNTSTTWWCGNYQTISWYLEPCGGMVTRRYYVVVNNSAWNEPNVQIRVGIRFEPAPPAYVLFDHYSEANQINGNPTTEYQPPYSPLVLTTQGTYTGYLGNLNCATADPTDQNHCNKTIWYKFTVGKTGRIRINYTRPGPNITTFNNNALILLREYVPGDSSSSGLGIVPLTSVYVNGNPDFNPSNYYYWGQACVYPGTYYIMFTGCDFPTETVYPRIWFLPTKGDLCSDPHEINITGAGSYTELSWIDCHTIGEAPGEDGSNMGCLQGPTGRKSQWFKVDVTGTGKYNIDVEVKDSTSVTADQIQYRIAYGDCNGMTFDNCVEEGAYIILNLKCRLPGSYWVQVVMPEAATGYVRLNLTATSVSDTSCNPIDPDKPRANFSFTGTCLGEQTFFTNLSTTGPGITYLWDFGDMTQSTQFNPIHVYADTGVYVVTLIATNGSQSDTTQQLVYIKPYPHPSFTVSPGPYYAGAPVTFTNTTTNTIPGAIYYWNFCADGGYCSATPNQYTGPNPPPVTWSTPGTKKICLTVNNWGCDSTYCFEIEVTQEAIFVGGPYDGHGSVASFSNCIVNVYAGGPYDGHGSVASLPNCIPQIFVGGPYDGHGMIAVYSNCTDAIFAGGPYDGHSSVAYSANCVPNIFAGGPYDGHSSVAYLANCVPNIFAGGPYDGHAHVASYSFCIPTTIWSGGPYDGHGSATYVSCTPPDTNIFVGGPHDGHGSVVYTSNCVTNVFAGGPYDGHGSVVYTSNCVTNVFAGGPYDGHGSVVYTSNCVTNIFAGGPYDGHGSVVYTSNCITNIFAGGPYDGHGSVAVFQNCISNVFAGGPYDGHGSVALLNNCLDVIFSGGPYDGHGSVAYYGSCNTNVFAGGPYDGHSSVTYTANCVQNIFVGGPYDGHHAVAWNPYLAPSQVVTCQGSTATLTTSAPTDWYAVPTGGSPIATNTNTYVTPPLTQTMIYYAQNLCAGGRQPAIAQMMPILTPDFNFTQNVCIGDPVLFYNQTIVTTNSVPSIGPSGYDIFQLGTTGVPPSPGRISFSSADYLNFSQLYDNVHQGYSAWSGNAASPSTQWVQWHYVSPKSVNRFYYWNYWNNANQSPKQLRLYYSTGGPWMLVKVWNPPYPSTGNFDTGFFPETNGIFANRWKLEIDVEADGPNWGEFQVYAGSPGLGGNVTWNFGDGSPTSTDQNPSHTYSTSGTYFVTLSANHNGCITQVTKPVTVSDCILPITQNYLTAQYNPQSTFIDLNWMIDGSFRTAYMQKLIGATWMVIDTFEFNGNLVYTTEDQQPLYNYNNVFRVRYLDENGKEGFSNVAEVYLDKAPEDYVVVYPNPLQGDELNIRFMSSADSPVKITLYNELGQNVYQVNEEVHTGMNEWVMPVGKLSLGVYYLVLESNHKNFHQKVVVFK